MFLLLIIVLTYGAVFSLSERFSSIMGIPHIVTVPSIAVFLLLVIYFLRKECLLKKYRIHFPKNVWRCLLLSMPLATVPIANAYLSIESHTAVVFYANEIPSFLLLAISAFFEELLFRSVLPVALSELFHAERRKYAVVANVLFAAMHMGNYLKGTSLATVFIQVLLAMSIGLCFSGITEESDSIFPAVCLHFFINISSRHSDMFSEAKSTKEILLWSVLSVLCFLYGAMLINRKGRYSGFETLY